MNGRPGSSEELEVLRQILVYLRDIATYQRREDLATFLADDDQRRAYVLSDGKRTAEQVRAEAELAVTDRTIRRWWEKWVEVGIAERVGEGQARAKYDISVLASLGTGIEA